jgi:hypothetical protein
MKFPELMFPSRMFRPAQLFMERTEELSQLECIALISRLCLGTLKLQVNQMSGNRLELKRRGSCAEERGGS